jgi:hypothetical protein
VHESPDSSLFETIRSEGNPSGTLAIATGDFRRRGILVIGARKKIVPVHVFFIGHSPLAHFQQDGNQAAAYGSESVFHPGRNLPVNFSKNKLVPFQFPKLFCEHPFGDARDASPQFPEPKNFLSSKMIENNGFPFTPHNFKGKLEKTSIFFVSQGFFLTPCLHGYSSDTILFVGILHKRQYFS